MLPNASFRAVLIGADSLLLECGDVLLDKGHALVAVVSDAPRVQAWAAKRGLRTLSLQAYAPLLAAESFDYLFAITHLAILPDTVLAMPRRAAINFHDGPLPRYAGLNAPAWALIHQEREYGITWHEIRGGLQGGGIDEGDILKQRNFEIARGETSLSLNTRNFAAAIESFSELVDELAAGTSTRRPQDLSQRSYFGKHLRPPAAALLDCDQPARELVATIRALDFGDYDNPLGSPKLLHRGQALCVRAAELIEESSAAAARTVTASGADGIQIATGHGSLRILELAQLSGARLPLSAAVDLLGLEQGEQVDALSQPLAASLNALSEGLARAEPFWVERLRTLEPATLALAQPERARAGSVAMLALDEPGAARNAADWLGVLALYVARSSGKPQCDFGYRDLRRAEHAPELAALLALQVPLRFVLDEAWNFAQTRSALQTELATLDKKSTFLRDSIARHPALRARPELAAGELAQVAILQRRSDEPVTLPPGAVCALVLDEQRAGVQLACDPDALDETARELLHHQLSALLTAALAQPSAAVGTLPLVSAAEAARLQTWNQSDLAVPHAATLTIPALFEAQVLRSPEQTALIFENEKLSYRELAARVERLASVLRSQGVSTDALVGVYVERGLSLVIACLGVLKAGGAYLPLDPSYPAERLNFMLADSGVTVVVTQLELAERLPDGVVPVDVIDAASGDLLEDSAPPSASGEQLAYVIYTSGSTGTPKGVMVEHRNVVNFFAGMDAVIPHAVGDVWLSVTSLSFDISVLELFWTLTRGLTVVIYQDRARQPSVASASEITGVMPRVPASRRARPIDFSLFMWGAQDTQSAHTYTLMLEAARFGDAHGFAAIWTPERHFHAFGGAYPNPSVTGAALAAITKHMQIRAGSCVVPLHHPARVAEEWSVVDNISGGRVGISFASGWQPDDFLLQPTHFKDNKRIMLEQIDQVRRLWRGEELGFPGPLGKEVRIRTQPRPVQAELPFWITAAGSPDTFRLAGSSGANVLTHLLGQTLDEVAEKIAAYRSARQAAGLDPQSGVVTLMLHTHIGETIDEVRERVREPMKAYLRSSVNLIKGFAWAFPAFKRPAGTDANPNDIDIGGLAEDELDAVLDFAFERYFETSGLFGTPESCRAIIARLAAIGVDDVACLIDFGVPTSEVLSGLRYLERLRVLTRPQPAAAGSADDEAFSLPAQIKRHGVTHLQCTPTLLRMARTDDAGRAAIDSVKHLLVGGEAFPRKLAEELANHVGTVTNMYGPTETTVWSATHRLTGAGAVPIGRPIANTRLYVLDAQRRPLPIGVPGELYIAGAGVVRGYYQRPELTAERFVPDAFAPEGTDARMYRSGDRARWSARGEVEFLGRTDHQVKLRGYRIELGEIEALLLRQSGVREAVVIAREDVPGDVRLVAYLTGAIDEAVLREAARHSLPSYMLPAAFVQLEQLPQTPNGKLDRRALPPPEAAAGKSARAYVAPQNDLEAVVVRLWCEVLGRERIGTDDNFFDSGGHSLLVVKLHRRLKGELPVEVALTDLYRFPTVRSLVSQLTGGGADLAVEQAQDRAALRVERQANRRDLASRRRSR
jgi:natural product biosynthesis luciferase-like monooxygenase protein